MKSALGQSYGNIQVIAVNDGSKDGTLAILEQLAAATLPLFKLLAPAKNCY